MRTVGIDLGTTNTVVALDGVVVQHFVDDVARSILPSVVAFPPSGQALVGLPARARRAIDPKNTIFSSKRLMGQSWHSYATSKFRRQYPFELVEQGGVPGFRTRAGTFKPEEIGAKIIEKAVGELFVEGARVRTHVTVPAAFDARACAATVEAAAQVGLLDVKVIPEPVAAAHAYLQRERGKGKRVAVFDLGGGTFDFAVVDFGTPAPRVLGHGGDPYLGGDDLDAMLADWVAHQVLTRFGWDLRTDLEVMDRLMVACEEAKVRLGLDTEARISLADVDPASPLSDEHVIIERDAFETLSKELVGRTFLICDQVLSAAGVSVRDVDAVFMSGGTTHLPIVREGVARYFRKEPRCEVNPMEVVAIGASLYQAEE